MLLEYTEGVFFELLKIRSTGGALHSSVFDSLAHSVFGLLGYIALLLGTLFFFTVNYVHGMTLGKLVVISKSLLS